MNETKRLLDIESIVSQIEDDYFLNLIDKKIDSFSFIKGTIVNPVTILPT